MLVQQSDAVQQSCSRIWCDKGSTLSLCVSSAQGTEMWWPSMALLPTFHGLTRVPGPHLACEDVEKCYFLAHRREGGQDYLKTIQWQLP